MAAVKLKAPAAGVGLDTARVAGHTALVPRRAGVDRPAERRVLLKQADVLPLRVQNVGPHSGQDVEIADELQQPLLVDEGIHGLAASLLIDAFCLRAERTKGYPFVRRLLKNRFDQRIRRER